MMYTFQPLPIVDTLNDHTGFYIIAFTLAMIHLLVWSTDEFKPVALIVFYAVLISGPAYISWHSGKITVPENTQVIGTLYDQWGEAHKEERRTGKTTSTVIVHNQYLTYQLPDGKIVNFPMNVGTAYPTKAILYRN